MHSRVWGIWLLILGVLWTPMARAAVESELVNQGVAAYKELDYAKATELLKRALAETLTREETIVVYQTLAFCHVAQDDRNLARSDFERVLRLEPSFELDRTISPRVRKVFEEARANVATGKSTLVKSVAVPGLPSHIAPQHPKEGEPVVLTLEYPGGVARKLRLFHRTRGKVAFSESSVLAASSSGKFSITVPGLSVQAPGFEYYLVLDDDQGISIAESGSFAAPLLLPVSARPKPIYKRAVFWGVLGGVLASGALAAILATTLIHSPSKNASVTITPQ